MQAEAKLQSSGCKNVSFAVGDLEHCQYPDQHFDAVLCSSAMFYVDLKAFGKRLYGWLKPGGLLAYNTLSVSQCLLPAEPEHSLSIPTKLCCCCLPFRHFICPGQSHMPVQSPNPLAVEVI